MIGLVLRCTNIVSLLLNASSYPIWRKSDPVATRLLDLASIDLSNQPGQRPVNTRRGFYLAHSLVACVVHVRPVSWLTWHDLIHDLYFFRRRRVGGSGGHLLARRGAACGVAVAEPLMPSPRDRRLPTELWTTSRRLIIRLVSAVCWPSETMERPAGRTPDHAVIVRRAWSVGWTDVDGVKLCRSTERPVVKRPYNERPQRRWPISLRSVASKSSSSSTPLMLLLPLHIYHLLQ